MAMDVGSVGGTWGTNGGSITADGLAGEIWDILYPLIKDDINSIVDSAGAPDLAGRNDAAQKSVNLCNAVAGAIIPHLIDNMEIDGDAQVLSVSSGGANVK